MSTLERLGLWLVIVAIGVAISMLSLSQAHLDARFVTTTTTSTTAAPNPLVGEVLIIKKELRELQANRGLSGPEVRALVETLLPEPPPPTTTPEPTTTTEERRR